MAEETNKSRKRRQKQIYHASHRKRASSSTTGRSKGIEATPIQRSMCASNRSYKNPEYATVMKSLGRKAGAK